MKKWITNSYTKKIRSIVFTHCVAERSNPDKTKTGNFDVLECTQWVNIIAFDKSGNLILVKQYRHGIDELTLEGPAGVIDDGEDPLETAKRELREETGYESIEWSKLGRVSANPAFQDNYCHIFLAKNCSKVSEQNLDPFEEIDVIKMSVDDARMAIENDEIHHSLFIAALGLYQLKIGSFS
jgi:8-oxo-dGTP pyrophosphatase MutT (NUDIX family)